MRDGENVERRDAVCAVIWALLAIHSVRSHRATPDTAVVKDFVKHIGFGGSSSALERGVASIWRAITGVPDDRPSLDDPDEDDDSDDSDSDDDDYGPTGMVMQHGF